MRNIALFLTYLGTHYHGWQVQKNLPTVAETMEKAAAMVVGHPVHMTGCGRTDAGVHARVYVANFRTSSTIPVERLPYALNTHLPCDIVVTKAFEVHENFNAIGSCARKEYTYQIYNSRLKDPFYVNRAWFYPRHLDENVMQAAASQFVGTHDFAAVRSVGTDVKSTVRTVYYLQCGAAGGACHSQGLRQRFPLQHGAGHGGDGSLRRRGKDTPGGDRRNSGLRQPHRRRPDSPGGRAVHDPSVV